MGSLATILDTPTLELLGNPQLRLPDGRTVELRQKAFALAALLHIEYRGRARRQVVADRLWETATASQASTNLRQVLLNTRSAEARHGFELFEADSTYIALSHSVRVDLSEIQRIRVDLEPERRAEMMRKSGRRTVPQIWIGDRHVGGCDDLYALDAEGKLDPLLEGTS